VTQDQKEKILVLLSCLALVFLIYGRTLAGGFVFDDRSVVEYKDTLRIEKWEQVARMPYWSEAAGLYRPVTLLSYAANFSILGESPLGFHLVNLLLYAFSCYLLYALVRRLFSDRALAASAAALFLVLPIHSEVVANIIGRAELLALLFSLLLFLELLKDEPQSWKMVIWAFAGMGSKETAVAAIPIALVVLFIAARKSFKRSFWEYFETASAILVGVGSYFFARLFVLGSFLPRVETSLVENPLMFAPFLNRIATALQVLTMYLQKSFWSFGLCSDYSYNQIPVAASFWNGASLLGILALALFVVGFFIFLKRRPAISLACAFFLFAYVPVSNLIMPIGTIAGERLVYFSSVGLVILAAAAIIFVAKRISAPNFAYLAGGLIVALAIFFGWRANLRSVDWLSEDRLFASAASCAPQSVMSRSNLGAAYYLRGDYANAEKELIAAQTIYDGYSKGVNNLGLVYWKTGRREAAREQFYQALKEPYPYPGAFENLALMSLEENDVVAANRWLFLFFSGDERAVAAYLATHGVGAK